MSVDYTLKLSVDWNNDGDFLDASEDVSSRHIGPIQVSRGRTVVTDEFKPGQFSFALENSSGDYSIFNTSGPLYGKLLPGRRCKLEATVSAVDYPVFYGYIQSILDSRAPASLSVIRFEALDAFDILRLGFTNTALQQNKRVDEILTAILDDIGWGAGDRDLNVGPETLPVFTNHNRLSVNALQLAAAQDPGSRLFMGADNKVIYRNRYAASLSASLATITQMRVLETDLRRDDFYDRVRATYPRNEVAAALSTVWTLALPRWLAPGVGSFEFELNATSVVAATGYVTPLVATTDFVCNSQLDGSGTSKTAQVSFVISSSSSGGGVLTWTNVDSAPVALTMCQVRAYAVLPGGELNVESADVSSPIVTRQKLSRDFEFLEDEAVVSGWVKWQANVAQSILPRLVINIIPESTAELATFLGINLGSRITLTNTSGIFPTGINEEFIVEALEWLFEPKGIPKCRLTLFHPDLALASMFRISGAAGGGQDYSQISSATAVSGDRFAF